MIDALKEQTVLQLAGLSEDQQLRVLDFARSLAAPDRVASRDLLRFAGAIEEEDLQTMSRAIEEGCEKIDPNKRSL
jgi:hypothetical protein